MSSASTKKSRVLAELRRRSMNRFQAERIGDHCLHSTVSALRREGHQIISQPETIETQYGRCRVMRYTLLREAS